MVMTYAQFSLDTIEFENEAKLAFLALKPVMIVLCKEKKSTIFNIRILHMPITHIRTI